MALPAATTIGTPRLTLRPQTTADAGLLHELWGERDARVPPHRRLDASGRPTVEDIAASIGDRPADRFWSVVRREGSEAVGYVGLLLDGRGTPEHPELAYEFLRRVHGNGYATEAAGAVVAWAAGHDLTRLCAGVRDWNVASSNVLRKLGFVEDGFEPDDGHGASHVFVRTFSRS